MSVLHQAHNWIRGVALKLKLWGGRVENVSGPPALPIILNVIALMIFVLIYDYIC